MTPERSRRERTTAVLLALVAGLLGLLAASRTWVTADVTEFAIVRAPLNVVQPFVMKARGKTKKMM